MSDHGHSDGHGDAQASSSESSHGPAVLPDAPSSRMITPAREDYTQPFPGAGLLWPVVWLLCAVILWQGATRWSGPVVSEHEAHESGPAHGE